MKFPANECRPSTVDSLLVVTHRFDLMAVQAMLEANPSARPVVACPHLADHCLSQGLAVDLLRPAVGEPVQEAYAQARRVARSIQQAADEALLAIDEFAPGCDWLQQELFYFSYNLLGFRALWARITASMPSQVRWVVPIADLPFRYGSHSFLPGMTLLEQLVSTGRAVQGLTYPLPAHDDDTVPSLDDERVAGPWGSISHLPTCFYDHAHFEAALLELQAMAGQKCLNLPAPHYDVEMPRLSSASMSPLTFVEARLGQEWVDRIEHAVELLAPRVDAALTSLIPGPRFRVPQVDILVRAWRRLMVFSAQLQQRFQVSFPSKLILSNHDTGLHGPLLSLARRHRASVTLVPHSKIFNSPIAELPGVEVRCAAHPVQGRPVIDSSGRMRTSHRLAFPEYFRWTPHQSRQLKTLGVLLSGVSYNSLCAADLPRYVDGLAQLKAWAQEHAVAFHLRCKPREPMIGLLSDGLQMAVDTLTRDMAGSLQAFIEGCDVCVTYDAPTSASVDVLSAGVPTFHVPLRPLLPEEDAMVSAELVRRVNVVELIEHLTRFQDDPVQLWMHARDQHQAYARAWSTAEPLSSII